MLVVALLLRRSPPEAVHWWHYALFGYATMAAVMPWLNGGIEAEELSLRYSLLAGLVYGVPVAIAAMVLRHSAHPVFAIWAHALLALWLLHLVIALVRYLRPTLPRSGPS